MSHREPKLWQIIFYWALIIGFVVWLAIRGHLRLLY